MSKKISGVIFLLLILMIQLASGLPYQYNTSLHINGSFYRNLSDYQISFSCNLSETGYPVFTYDTVDMPHYDNIFDTCTLPGDENTIWIKVPEIPREGLRIRMWYNGIIPNPVNIDNNCNRVFEFYDVFSDQTYVLTRKWGELLP